MAGLILFGAPLSARCPCKNKGKKETQSEQQVESKKQERK